MAPSKARRGLLAMDNAILNRGQVLRTSLCNDDPLVHEVSYFWEWYQTATILRIDTFQGNAWSGKILGNIPDGVRLEVGPKGSLEL
ncbi:hypothetical protein TNCV_5113291 [Trichonephila clavipes]|nr:hypothetical protein TNCV_5113291 [Trichonephila clavipes]